MRGQAAEALIKCGRQRGPRSPAREPPPHRLLLQRSCGPTLSRTPATRRPRPSTRGSPWCRGWCAARWAPCSRRRARRQRRWRYVGLCQSGCCREWVLKLEAGRPPRLLRFSWGWVCRSYIQAAVSVLRAACPARPQDVYGVGKAHWEATEERAISKLRGAPILRWAGKKRALGQAPHACRACWGLLAPTSVGGREGLPLQRPGGPASLAAASPTAHSPSFVPHPPISCPPPAHPAHTQRAWRLLWSTRASRLQWGWRWRRCCCPARGASCTATRWAGSAARRWAGRGAGVGRRCGQGLSSITCRGAPPALRETPEAGVPCRACCCPGRSCQAPRWPAGRQAGGRAAPGCRAQAWCLLCPLRCRRRCTGQRRCAPPRWLRSWMRRALRWPSCRWVLAGCVLGVLGGPRRGAVVWRWRWRFDMGMAGHGHALGGRAAGLPWRRVEAAVPCTRAQEAWAALQ